MMTLTDVYCRVNRARGMELLSPEDLLNASRQLDPLGLPIVLRIFDSGVMVLQLRTHNDIAITEFIANLVNMCFTCMYSSKILIEFYNLITVE